MPIQPRKVKRTSPENKSSGFKAFIQRMVDVLHSDAPEFVKRRIVESEVLYDETDLMSYDNSIYSNNISIEARYNI